LGNVVRYDYVWRTGANAATQFETSAPLILAGKKVPAGKYTLWTIPHEKGADLLVNRQTGQWGTHHEDAQDLDTAAMKTETVATPVEKFTIGIAPSGKNRGVLTMEWGTFRWTAPIEVR